MDLRKRCWHGPTLECFGLEESMLPEIRSNAEVYGHVRDGPLAGVPIAGAVALLIDMIELLDLTCCI